MEQVMDEKTFKEAFELVSAHAREIFDKDGYHSHMLFFISKDRSELMALLYDQVAFQVAQDVEKGKELSHANRDRVFAAVALVAYQAGAVGYFEIGEGWGLTPSIEPSSSPERTLQRYRDAHKEYEFIKDMPIKLEILFVRGRFRDWSGMLAWKIKRQGEAVWLEPLEADHPELKIIPYTKDEISRAGMIDQAVDRVLQEEELVT
jgi:hypothetical protein